MAHRTSKKVMPLVRVPKGGTSLEAAAARRALFIEAYLSNGYNGTRAAITAGYSPTSAEATAVRMLRDHRVRDVIALRKKELQEKFSLNTENVLREVARVAYFDIAQCYDAKGKLKNVHDIPEDTRRALAAMEGGKNPSVKSFDKNTALRNAMAHLQLLNKQAQSVTAISVAAAQVKANVKADDLTALELARRIAYTLHMGMKQLEAQKAQQTAPESTTT